MRYRDRVHAGRELACELAGRVAGAATVLAVSDDAAEVARAVARSLGASFDRLRPDDVGRNDGDGCAVTGCTVVLVDDGMTTGSAMVAACDLVREAGARRVVAAAPVAGVDAIGRARSVADEVVVLQVECEVGRVDDWFEHPATHDGSQGAPGGDPGPHGHGPAVLLQAG